MLGQTTSLEVRVDGNVDPYEREIQRAERATRSYERSLESLNRDLLAAERMMQQEAATRLAAQHAAYEKVGRGMMIAGAATLVGAGLAAKAAMDWESAWAGVEKTVEGTPEEMARLEEGLRGLATTLPATHEEIAGVAEAAGQLGVAREDVVGFTKTMVDLGETTNLSAQDAATSLARFMNIMGTAGDDVSRVGATLVDLGNKGASTEREIMELGLRLAGAGNQAGFTEGEVLGVANALSSLGINAEAGGSAVSTMIVKWTGAVEEGGAKLDALAQTAGMTSEEFAALWTSDAAAGFEAVISGMQRIDAEGGSVLQTLGQLEVTEIRQRDAMLRLVGGGDLLAQSLRDGNEAWAENMALLVEAEKRYATTESKVEVARNQLYDAAITIGASLLPVVASLADFVSNVVTAFSDLPGPVKAVMGPAAALMGLILLLGGAFMSAVPKVAAFNAALASGNLTGNMQRAGMAAKGLMGALAGPWGLALGVGITALTVFAAKQGASAQQIDAVKATLDEQTGALTANSTAWAVNELSSSGALDKARQLGLDLGMVTQAALGNADAQAELNAALGEFQSVGSAMSGIEYAPDFVQGLYTSTGLMDDNAVAAEELQQQIFGLSGAVDEGKTEWQLEQEAMEGATGAAREGKGAQEELGGAVEGTTGDLQEQAAAASKVVEALTALNSIMLQARGGARGYEAALDAAWKELKTGAKTLNIHTEEGRKNAETMDAIAGQTIEWAKSLAKVDKSGQRSLEVMRQGRKDLYQVALAYMGSEEAARKYVNQVLGIPKSWKTAFTTPGAEESADKADRVGDKVRGIPTDWHTLINVNTGNSLADIAALEARMNAIQDETVFINVRRIGGPQAGGMADGGPVYGGVPGVDSVPKVLMQGEHVWTTREVEAAGGHGAMFEMRRAALSGEVARGWGSAPGASPHAGRSGTSGPMELVGTLTIPGLGSGYIRGIVREELGADASFGEAMAGRRAR